MRCSIAGLLPWPHRADGIEEPEALRRVDGSSVYTVAGADLYTSQRILDAEPRLVAAAGRRDGAVRRAVGGGSGPAGDGGERHRPGCWAGVAGPADVHLRVPGCSWRSPRPAPARPPPCVPSPWPGPKTAARCSASPRPLPRPLFLASRPASAPTPSPNSPGPCGTATCPDWAAAVGPSTLVIIDEAGMADTLTLDAAVQFAIDRGASVRLVGDDQQLAAIGAGGVLRDIKHTHGALHLAELHRFTNPAEAAASLALREGKPTALDFYLDHGRVHVGDIATTTEDAFTAWVADRAAGLDAIMLAPTRELVAELNRRARTHRLDHTPAASEVRLADGNQASVGDVIITRSNDRRLRLTATDWVKNGDRWTITRIGQQR